MHSIISRTRCKMYAWLSFNLCDALCHAVRAWMAPQLSCGISADIYRNRFHYFEEDKEGSSCVLLRKTRCITITVTDSELHLENVGGFSWTI